MTHINARVTHVVHHGSFYGQDSMIVSCPECDDMCRHGTKVGEWELTCATCGCVFAVAVEEIDE